MRGRRRRSGTWRRSTGCSAPTGSPIRCSSPWARCAASTTTRACTSRPTSRGWARRWWAAGGTIRCSGASATTAPRPASPSRWGGRSWPWSRRTRPWPCPVRTSSSSTSRWRRRAPWRSRDGCGTGAGPWRATSSAGPSRSPSPTRASSARAGRSWSAGRGRRTARRTACACWISGPAASAPSRSPSCSRIPRATSRVRRIVAMPNIVVVGAQWGDEGKGKVVDVLAACVDVTVRYQGGNNAGHTVVVGKEKFVLQSIPSGILHPGCRCVVGCGVVIDPASIIEEMESLVRRGVALDGNLYISKNAHLIMPYHPALDRASESKAGKHRIGTTGKGVGPAYADKTARVGIRMADLLDERLLREKLEYNVAQKNRLLREIYDAESFTVDGILSAYLRYAGWLAPYITDTALILHRWMEAGSSVLFEGAQGTMLDLDHGTYPFITSSSTTAGGACTGSGVPPTRINGVIGISKAYCTRVGGGPFPTELHGEIAHLLRSRG